MKTQTVDSRALTGDELKMFKEGGILFPFIKLVNNHDKLELCFRGNNSPKSVSIYYNNRQVYKINLNGTVEISYRTARYWKACEEYYNKLVDDYHFKGEKSFKEFLFKKKYSMTKIIKEDDDYEEIYIKVLKPMLCNYEENNDTLNYFKKIAENKEIHREHPEQEKKAQQRLFHEFKDIKAGYFFHDLEFHQTKNANDNKPDMLGIYFGNDGKPKKLVFVEVKSTTSSIGDKNDKTGSGIMGHLAKTKLYINDPCLMKNRKEEACDIINSYAELGLRGLRKRVHFEYRDFESITPQALFLFTDCAENYIKKNINDFQCFDGKQISVGEKGCSAYAFEEEDLRGLNDIVNYEQNQLY